MWLSPVQSSCSIMLNLLSLPFKCISARTYKANGQSQTFSIVTFPLRSSSAPFLPLAFASFNNSFFSSDTRNVCNIHIFQYLSLSPVYRQVYLQIRCELVDVCVVNFSFLQTPKVYFIMVCPCSIHINYLNRHRVVFFTMNPDPPLRSQYR